jgi:pimeloyl-ACP methyl ester carboxylesterase
MIHTVQRCAVTLVGRLPFLVPMETFEHEGHQLAYTEYGSGPRVCVLVHGLLLNQEMHRPLAEELAARGHRVITMDLLGHGASDRPPEMWKYAMPFFGRQVVALLDHLDVDQAVVLGTSLGANTALEIASESPERLRGMVIEMPVLDNALLACAVVFTPLMVALTFGEPLARALAGVARRVPRRPVPQIARIGLDAVSQDPKPSAAVLHGLFFGRTAPHRNERKTFTTPTLVLGHRRDPVHPFSDAGMLASELQDSRLIEANSILELRLAPERLTDEIAAFLDECWKPRRADSARRPRKSA